MQREDPEFDAHPHARAHRAAPIESRPCRSARCALLDAHDDVLAYERRVGGERYIIVLNFCMREATWEMPENVTGEIVLSTRNGGVDQDAAGEIRLRPDEGVIIRCHR